MTHNGRFRPIPYLTAVSADEPTDGKFFVSESANYDIVCNLATKKWLLPRLLIRQQL